MKKQEISNVNESCLGRLSEIPTSTIANALDEFGFHNNVLRSIKSVSPNFRLLGPAVTVKEITGEVGTFSSDDFAIGQIIDSASAGTIIVIEEGGKPYSTWGGMASLAAGLKGISGLVVDGGVRDVEEIIKFEFPVFAKHLVPTTGRTRIKVEAINVPITVDGVLIYPGDIILGDGTGVLSIPFSKAQGIVELAEKYVIDDNLAAAEIKSGLSFSDAMAKFKRI